MTSRPVALHGPFAWHGDALRHESRWQHVLQPREIDDLDSALQHVRRRGVPLADSNPGVFPLPNLTAKPAAIGNELETGCGMVRLRALPITRWSPEELRIIWFGLATHLGRPVFQNAHGELLREICDEDGDAGARYGQLRSGSETFLSSRARTASNAELRFHTDRCDIDMQFLNNHVIYHARTAFTDAPQRGKSPSLLRVWLSSQVRALPHGHEVLWRAVESGEARGGIGQAAGLAQ